VSARDFDHLHDFLQYQIEKSLIGSTGRKVSNLETVARQLGYKSPSILSMVLKGQRIPSEEMIDAMSQAWNLNASDREFFRLLVQIERQKKKGKDPSDVTARLKKLSKNKGTFTFSLNQFNLIRDWYYHVIKELVATPGFVEDPLWISRKLRKKVSPAQAKKALEVLLEMGILYRDAETGRLRTNVEYTESTRGLPSEAIRTHNTGMIQRALEAIQEQPLEKRHFNSLTLTVDAKRLPEIKEKLTKVMREFYAEFESGQSDHVYQLNVQFFEHTRDDSGVVLRSGSNETQ
jgi:uncharacterized protein (TIGR02147 family)